MWGGEGLNPPIDRHCLVGLQCWGNMEAVEGQHLVGMSVVPS